MKNNVKRISKIVVLFALITLPLIAWTQRWDIYDALRLRNYQPPAEIAQIATETTLKDGARRLFYVYYPALNDKQEFNDNCNTSEKTIVLGCYVSGEGIYLFNVTDTRLDGIIQVTAAHEMLHAAYERLSGDEKERINELTQDVYRSLNNPRIAESISEYQKNGADIANELHSIIGTEVRELPPELESYYARYFNNRLKIVEYSEKYEQAFTERKQKVAEYDKRLADLKQLIDSKELDIESRKQALNAERARLDSLLAAKAYDSYNAAVSAYNSNVTAYNKVVRDVRSLIDEFNQLVAARNSIVSEEVELINAIDSRPDTFPVQ